MMTNIRKAALSEKSRKELLKRKQMRENIKSNSTQKQQEQIKNTREYQAPRPKQKEVTEGFIKKNWNKLGKGGKIAAITVPTVAAVGTGIAIKKHKDKKKNK